MKVCGLCGEEKGVSEFYRNRAQRDGLCGYCIACSKRCAAERKDKAKVYMAAYDAERQYKRYGITRAEFVALHEQQGGMCRICARTIRVNGPAGSDRAVLDHCHVTGRVRGVLCNHCNMAIGLLGESVDNVRRAAEYLA